MNAKKIIFPQPRKAVLVDFDLDDRPAPHELLIESLYSVISAGTEGAAFSGLEREHPGTKNFKYPRPQTGYGNIGCVLKAGESVKEDYGEIDIVFSTAPHATHALVDTQHVCVKVPDGMDLKHAIFARMAGVAITAVRKSSFSAGDSVLVIGGGLVGNFCAQEFQIAGCDVMLSDISKFRLEKARQCGIRKTVNPNQQDIQEVVSKWTLGAGAQIVVEATGETALIDQGVQLTRRHGEIILLGSPRRRVTMEVTPMLSRIHLQGITMKGALEWLYAVPEYDSVRHSVVRNTKQIFGWLADGRLKTEPLLTHVLPPDECQQAYSGLADRKDECLGVVFDWA